MPNNVKPLFAAALAGEPCRLPAGHPLAADYLSALEDAESMKVLVQRTMGPLAEKENWGWKTIGLVAGARQYITTNQVDKPAATTWSMALAGHTSLTKAKMPHKLRHASRRRWARRAEYLQAIIEMAKEHAE